MPEKDRVGRFYRRLSMLNSQHSHAIWLEELTYFWVAFAFVITEISLPLAGLITWKTFAIILTVFLASTAMFRCVVNGLRAKTHQAERDQLLTEVWGDMAMTFLVCCNMKTSPPRDPAKRQELITAIYNFFLQFYQKEGLTDALRMAEQNKDKVQKAIEETLEKMEYVAFLNSCGKKSPSSE